MINGYEDTRFVSKYDKSLKLPIIRTLHALENKALSAHLASITKSDEILEIGAGTGRKTVKLCSVAKKVTGIEPSIAMMTLLQKKLDPLPKNLSLYTVDFFCFETNKKFDVVIAEGVLDYVENWTGFLDKCRMLARKRVVVTLKAKGILPIIYTVGSRLSGLKIYTHSEDEIRKYIPDGDLQKISLGKGLAFTWVLSFNTEHVKRR